MVIVFAKILVKYIQDQRSLFSAQAAAQENEDEAEYLEQENLGRNRGDRRHQPNQRVFQDRNHYNVHRSEYRRQQLPRRRMRFLIPI